MKVHCIKSDIPTFCLSLVYCVERLSNDIILVKDDNGDEWYAYTNFEGVIVIEGHSTAFVEIH